MNLSIPLFEYGGQPWTSLGLPMSQNRLAVPIWSYVIEQEKPQRIIEIGTNCGGFTVALGFQAYNQGECVIFTFDTGERPGLFDRWPQLPIFFCQGDCFSSTVQSVIEDLIQREGKTFILCDGGNKIRELNTFALSMKPGDAIAAHDYSIDGEIWPWGEITKDDVTAESLLPFYRVALSQAGWLGYTK